MAYHQGVNGYAGPWCRDGKECASARNAARSHQLACRAIVVAAFVGFFTCLSTVYTGWLQRYGAPHWLQPRSSLTVGAARASNKSAPKIDASPSPAARPAAQIIATTSPPTFIAKSILHNTDTTLDASSVVTALTGEELNQEAIAEWSANNYGLAKTDFEEAYKARFWEAAAHIGHMYELGNLSGGTSKMLIWYKRGYDHKESLATYRLGLAVHNGDGVSANPKLGCRYLNLASSKVQAAQTAFKSFCTDTRKDFSGLDLLAPPDDPG